MSQSPYPHIERFLEILPAVITWLTFILPLFLTHYFPQIIAILILAFDIWWFLRSMGTIFYLWRAFRRFRKTLQVNWSTKLRKYLDYHQLNYPRHIILISTYKEPEKLVAESIRSWAEQKYPMKRVMLVLAGEGREGEEGRKKIQSLERKFRDDFGQWVSTFHPDGLPNEMKGRGSNTTWAMRQVEKIVEKEGWDPKKILVTSIDADSQTVPHFLSYLTLRHLRAKNRQRKSLRPLPFYFNNLWQVPAFSRLLAIGSTLFHMMNSIRPHHSKNFSAFTYTFWQLRKIDYYPVDTPVEDYRSFYKCYIENRGKTDVIPLYLPVSMDAVDEDTFWKTIKAQYIQIRRWASGCSHLAWFVPRFLQNWREYPLRHTFWEIWENLFIKNWTWATAPLILLSGAWITLLNQQFADTIFGYNLPIITGRILTAMLLGILISFGINFAIIRSFQPKRAPRTQLRKILSVLEWILIPPLTIIFGAIPAIDSQTRLAFGQIVKFEVTRKKR